eukprot:GHVT01095403.1.p3 GENE.GHVT01095403.1~~GHVT01095403.1.p3  ORF type:complete len:104 (-),score=9.13 GHVT01095403.1:1042-1353(-)
MYTRSSSANDAVYRCISGSLTIAMAGQVGRNVSQVTPTFVTAFCFFRRKPFLLHLFAVALPLLLSPFPLSADSRHLLSLRSFCLPSLRVCHCKCRLVAPVVFG